MMPIDQTLIILWIVDVMTLWKSPMYLTDKTVAKDQDTKVICNHLSSALVAISDPLMTNF